MGSFYSISAAARGVQTYSFFSLSITSGLITNGGVQYVNPTQAQSTYVNTYANTIQSQGAPADVTLGAAINSDDPVTGTILASPPANVDVTVTLYGLGKTLGTYVLRAGQSSGEFRFEVNSADAIPESEVQAALAAILPERAQAPRS